MIPKNIAPVLVLLQALHSRPSVLPIIEDDGNHGRQPEIHMLPLIFSLIQEIFYQCIHDIYQNAENHCRVHVGLQLLEDEDKNLPAVRHVHPVEQVGFLPLIIPLQHLFVA